MMQRVRQACAASWFSLLLLFLGTACSEGAEAAPPSPAAAGAIAHHALTGAPTDYDPLLAAIGDVRFVLLGESTHGTREFYGERARITERLVREKGVLAVAIEGD